MEKKQGIQTTPTSCLLEVFVRKVIFEHVDRYRYQFRRWQSVFSFVSNLYLISITDKAFIGLAKSNMVVWVRVLPDLLWATWWLGFVFYRTCLEQHGGWGSCCSCFSFLCYVFSLFCVLYPMLTVLQHHSWLFPMFF